MSYVFDTSSFSVFQNYYPSQFPGLWRRLDSEVQGGRIISVREVRRELESLNRAKHLDNWITANREIFAPSSEEEMAFVAEIFQVQHFEQIVRRKQLLEGTPVADPFVIAAAKVRQWCVVTQESSKPNAAGIPNVCNHFQLDCTNLEGFMTRESWVFD